MKTLPAILLLLLHCLFAADSLQAAASDATNRVRGSELPTTNSLQWSNTFLSVIFPYPHPYYTNGTMQINASNLAVALGAWITNGGSGGGTGEVTTAQLLASSNAVYSAQAAKAPTNNANLGTTSSSGIPLTLRAAAGQDGNMLNVRDSSGNIIFAIAYDGQLVGVGANSARLASTSTAGDVWTASDTTGIGTFTAPAQQTNSSIVRQTQLTTASNALVTILTSYDTTTSNGLYALILGGGITANTATNIAQYFATNSAIVTSNQLVSTLAPKSSPTFTGTVTISSGTANELVAFDALKGLVPVTGVSATEAGYLDGVTSLIQNQIDAKGTTNPVVLAAGSLLSSNVFLQKVAHLGTNNVQVWDASTSTIADVQMFGNTTLVFTNMGTFTNYAGTNWTGTHVARVRNVSGALTIASPQPVTFGSTFIATGKTNWLTIRYQNGAWHGSVSEVQTTGTEGSAYVLATAPTISGATIALASGSTNLIESQTEDTTPTTNDTVLVHDKDTASLKRVAITNLRGTSSGGGMAALEVQTNGVRAGMITNVNFGNGFTGAVSGSTITLAEYRTGASIGEVSVLDYGADLTGATDSTLAFQAAATNPAIYIPPGTYVITNVIVTNATIRGLVGKSIVRFNTNAVPYGFMFDTRSNLTHWRGITFDGGSTTNLRAFTTSDEARSGLKMYIAGDATVQNCTFINWHSNAVYVSGTNDITGRANHFRFQDNTITNCWTGLHLPSPNLAEYSIVTGNKIAWCNIGLRNDNANVTVAGNSIHDCAVGLTSYDTTAGRSHSRYTGNTFHHSKVSWQNALTGFGFVGNNMLGSTTVELLAPAFGGLFEGNYFEQFTVTDYSGGTNWFFGNQISGTISQGGTSTSIYDRNRYTTGIPVSEVSSLTYVTTNIHIHPMRANNFAVILTNNAGFTIGTGGDGQIIRLRLTQDGTGSRTVAWTNLFNFSTTYPAPTLSTGIGKTDWIEAQYWTASNRWDVIRTDIGH